MRDITLLGFTLLAMRDLGEGHAQLVREDRNHQGWFAGGQPLNGQAVRDLIADGLAPARRGPLRRADRCLAEFRSANG
jgi:hypothetical protein